MSGRGGGGVRGRVLAELQAARRYVRFPLSTTGLIHLRAKILARTVCGKALRADGNSALEVRDPFHPGLLCLSCQGVHGGRTDPIR